MKLMWKELFRTIGHSLGRFIAIASIIALGVGFYGGLRMACNDMKIVSSQYYSDTNLMDIRVVSTLGLSQNNIDEMQKLDCVDEIMPAYETDVLANHQGSQNAIRLHSLNEACYQSQNIDNKKVESDAQNFINRPILLEGQWPKNADECVISKKVSGQNQQNIGDEIEITECSGKIDETLKTNKLKIVGFVKSSYYVCTNRLGATTLGRGTVEQYAYVPENSFADDFPYTEAFITVKGAKNYYYNSDQYQKTIDAAMKDIQNIAPEQSQIRSADVKSEVNNKIEDGQKELDQKRVDAQNELNNNEEKLRSSKLKLIQGKKQINDGQNQLDAGYAEYQRQYNEVFAQINLAKQTLAYAKHDFTYISQKLTANLNNLETYFNQVCENYEDALVALPKLISELNTSKNLLAETKSIAIKYITDKEILDQIEQIIETVYFMFDEVQNFSTDFYNDLNSASQDKKQEVYDSYILDFIDAFYFLDIAKQYISDAFVEIDKKIEEADREIALQENTAIAKFSEAKGALDAAQDELNKAKRQYEEGNNEYLDGLKKFNSAKEDALNQLNTAQEQIDDSRQKANEIENAEFLIMDRSKVMGCINLVNDAERIDGISQVFPFIFFLVAALVALTSMTRMVEEERILIGTYKALGISPYKITGKYIAYILIAGIIGSIVGLIIIPQVVPIVILTAYTIIYDNPFPYIMPFDWSIAVISIAMGLGISLLATIAASIKSLKQVPANLMLPKAPKAGKKILLEYIKPLWKMLSFNWKIALRNMILYKKRLFMTIIGIAGCTALLLTGFGLSDSINDIINMQYDRILYDNFSATFNKNLDENMKKEINTVLKDQQIENHIYMHEENFVVQPVGKPECIAILNVPQDTESFNTLRKLQNRTTKEEISLNDGDVLINEKQASLMHVGVGDEIEVFEQDKIGNAGAKSFKLKVTGIFENYVAHYIYMTKSTYEKYFDKECNFNSLFLRYVADDQKQTEFSNKIYDIKGIKTAVYTDKAKETYRKMLSSVDMIVVVLIVFAAILAFVVLFNLTNINICERMREIATLKVLGSRRREISLYIHRETLILSFIGAIVGIGLGFIMETFVIISAEIDYVMFGRNIYLPSIIYSVLITMIFTIIVIFMTRKKIQNISMVESLKSID